MPDIETSDARLVALLDTIVPSRGTLPGAGGLGLAASVIEDARANDHLADLISVVEALPVDFADLGQVDRESALRDIESSQPHEFASVVNMVYTAYYTQPQVLAGISERTGYNPGPPQPSGYHLEPFDDHLLAPVRGRTPMWRSDHV